MSGLQLESWKPKETIPHDKMRDIEEDENSDTTRYSMEIFPCPWCVWHRELAVVRSVLLFGWDHLRAPEEVAIQGPLSSRSLHRRQGHPDTEKQAQTDIR